jgi:hypothetical protein
MNEINEFNLTIDDTYVVLKLVTGEQIMAVKRNESPTSVTIEYPMLIKSFPFMNDGEIGEHVTAAPYCKFTEDKLFEFKKRDIVFEKKVHQYAIPFYVRLVNEYEATIEELDEHPSTVEELSDRVNNLMEHLKSIAEGREEETEEEEAKAVVRGNSTLH